MAITQFKGEYRFLSNFYKVDITFKDQVWPSSEHLFQASKSEDPAVRETIRLAMTPGETKAAGRKIKLRKDWEEVKVGVMKYILRLKFEQHPDLRNKLIGTSPHELIEGNNWHDNFWGNCSCRSCYSKPGQNVLGKLLMELREELTK